ncbi:MAG: hypothetical protein ACPGUV_09975 [Polyangiales bacterium]
MTLSKLVKTTVTALLALSVTASCAMEEQGSTAEKKTTNQADVCTPFANAIALQATARISQRSDEIEGVNIVLPASPPSDLPQLQGSTFTNAQLYQYDGSTFISMGQLDCQDNRTPPACVPTRRQRQKIDDLLASGDAVTLGVVTDVTDEFATERDIAVSTNYDAAVVTINAGVVGSTTAALQASNTDISVRGEQVHLDALTRVAARDRLCSGVTKQAPSQPDVTKSPKAPKKPKPVDVKQL